jgi:4-O-beta-D-mannosyl-D-glucose phosphorylase
MEKSRIILRPLENPRAGFLRHTNAELTLAKFPRTLFRMAKKSSVVGRESLKPKSSHGDVFIYYGSSDTRTHAATTTVEKLLDYITNTPPDAMRSKLCVEQRCQLIANNLKLAS